MLNKKQYFVREHVGMFKLSNAYDILDPDTQQQLGIAKEEISGGLHFLRFFVNKQLLPTTVNVYEGTESNPSKMIFSIKKGFAFFSSKVDVIGRNGQTLGWFKSKVFSLGGAFRVFDDMGTEIALVKGDWKGWNFKFLFGDEQIGSVSKKWSGVGKELFTTADNYMISLEGEVNEAHATLLLAAGLSIDIVYKER
ncbi:phospholipid scramblase-related protein [Candidatus Uabimicrobium amorphum]|uniref:RNAse n=1 Tax=Uabimicrobium amorphum TaxID=2596890 RepID=A0A5S9IK70_UABAM|nr:phospholipid scramblase-related protein [Candidatus Uabimicrobium amorphum]BBM83389.1 RNAse [Candidatus Uabimicrobium amorphum]